MSVRVISWEDFDPRHFQPRRSGRLPRHALRPIDWERANVGDIASRDGWTCAYCGCDVEWKGSAERDRPSVPAVTLDHVVPTVLGGGDTNYNAVLACGACNSRKGARHPALMFA